MKGKLAFLTGAALGYVLGSRAGRERYEQIKRIAKKLWNTEPVQRSVGAVRHAADERAGDLKQAAQRVGAQVLGKISEQMSAASNDQQTAKKAAASPTKKQGDA